MTSSLKELNKKGLVTVIVANLAVFYAMRNGTNILDGDWTALTKHWTDLFKGGVGLIVAGLLNAQFSAECKARIVFWRWHHPLPGCEAFTKYAREDHRVDLAALEKKIGTLPTDPAEQNAQWYKLYKPLREDIAVKQAHREFLFYRDYACLTLIMLIALGGMAFALFPSSRIASYYLALLAVQFLLASNAARNHGRRMVTTVLALKGSSK